MIAPSVVEEVLCLLEENRFSERKIAATLGIHRNTVAMIAAGRRPRQGEPLPPRIVEPPEPSDPLARCPECGGMVYLPCRLCKLRKLPSPGLAKRPAGMERLEPLGLHLRGQHRQRYEEVRARRAQQAKQPGDVR